jgi:hypothetical protein
VVRARLARETAALAESVVAARKAFDPVAWVKSQAGRNTRRCGCLLCKNPEAAKAVLEVARINVEEGKGFTFAFIAEEVLVKVFGFTASVNFGQAVSRYLRKHAPEVYEKMRGSHASQG